MTTTAKAELRWNNGELTVIESGRVLENAISLDAAAEIYSPAVIIVRTGE